MRVRTEAMAYGPHAVGHHEGKVVFVRGAAPEEEVEVEVREDHGRYAFADVLSVLRASTARRLPPCRFLPRCGGCPWQHLGYAAQLEAKRALVRDQLQRIGRIGVAVEPVIPSPGEFAYRHRLKLRVEPAADPSPHDAAGRGVPARVGFYAAASHELVEIDECLLLPPDLSELIPAVRDLAAALGSRLRRAELIDAGGGRAVLCCEAEGNWDTADSERCPVWLAQHRSFRGLTIAGRGWRQRFGDDRVTVSPEPDLELRVHAGTFTQVNPAGNQLLVRTVLERIGASEGARVLDLYSGAGNFSLPLARRGARVLAVEQSRQACGDGAENARRLGLTSCRFACERVERFAHRLAAEGRRFDAILLDPPRSGASGAVEAIVRLAPQRVVYVSCDPATLARDLRRLDPRFRVETVQPIDLFPHTHHVETVVTLRRSAVAPAP
jgi:23S rRNA (uracil1939-C5)-methyltransferase